MVFVDTEKKRVITSTSSSASNVNGSSHERADMYHNSRLNDDMLVFSSEVEGLKEKGWEQDWIMLDSEYIMDDIDTNSSSGTTSNDLDEDCGEATSNAVCGDDAMDDNLKGTTTNSSAADPGSDSGESTNSGSRSTGSGESTTPTTADSGIDVGREEMRRPVKDGDRESQKHGDSVGFLACKSS